MPQTKLISSSPKPNGEKAIDFSTEQTLLTESHLQSPVSESFIGLGRPQRSDFCTSLQKSV